MKIKLLFPMVLFLLLAFFLWKGLSRNPRLIPSPLIGKPVPSFSQASLKDPNKLLNNTLFKGHLSLLNVFATWCLSCRAEDPVLIDAARSKRVSVFGLNYKDQRQTALKWLNEYGNPYQAVIYDPDGQFGLNLGVYGTPETFLIDFHGTIRYKYIGPVSPDVWTHRLLPEIKKLEKEA